MVQILDEHLPNDNFTNRVLKPLEFQLGPERENAWIGSVTSWIIQDHLYQIIWPVPSDLPKIFEEKFGSP